LTSTNACEAEATCYRGEDELIDLRSMSLLEPERTIAALAPMRCVLHRTIGAQRARICGYRKIIGDGSAVEPANGRRIVLR
jgi:hypothetical protein